MRRQWFSWPRARQEVASTSGYLRSSLSKRNSNRQAVLLSRSHPTQNAWSREVVAPNLRKKATQVPALQMPRASDWSTTIPFTRCLMLLGLSFKGSLCSIRASVSLRMRSLQCHRHKCASLASLTSETFAKSWRLSSNSSCHRLDRAHNSTEAKTWGSRPITPSFTSKKLWLSKLRLCSSQIRSVRLSTLTCKTLW